MTGLGSWDGRGSRAGERLRDEVRVTYWQWSLLLRSLGSSLPMDNAQTRLLMEFPACQWPAHFGHPAPTVEKPTGRCVDPIGLG